jgi:hypothetical protein
MKYPGDPSQAARSYFYQLGLLSDDTKRVQTFLDGIIMVQHQPKTEALSQAAAVTALAHMKLAEGDVRQVTVYDADNSTRLIEGVLEDGNVTEIPPAEYDVVLGSLAKLLRDARQKMPDTLL